MKIYLPQKDRKVIGGGWTFTNNLKKTLKGKVKFVDKIEDCDIFFIPGSTMTDRVSFVKAKELKKKIILRVDGIPEDWRNRGTGWSRLRDYSKDADIIIYQTKFIKNTIGGLLKKDGYVIYNGVDKSIFKPLGEKFPEFGNPCIINLNYRNDPNKRIEEVITRFRELKFREPEATITFVGKYPVYLLQWKFGMLDFKAGIDWNYTGVIGDRKILAKILRSGDYFAFPSFADPCPNSLIEALACGLKPLWINDYGGAKEIIDNWGKVDFTIETMGSEYLALFKQICIE